MKYIKILGIKDYLLYKLFQYIEITLNAPYMILRGIIGILYVLFDVLDDLFSEERIIKLRKIRKVDEFHRNCYDKLKKTRTYKVK